MFNYILYRLGQFIALHLPVKAVYKIAAFVSDLRLLFARRDCRETDANLKVIFPQKSDKEIIRLRVSLFRNFSKYLVDFFCFSRIDKSYIKKRVKIENIDYIKEAISAGKGAIALTAHIGNWELGAVVIALSGYSFWAVALPHKHKAVDKFFNYQRQRKGVNVIPLNRAVRQCLKLLEENKVIGLVGDRDINYQGVVMDFFGKPTSFPEGPAAFSLKTGAPIVCGFMIRNPDDTFTFRFEKPISYPSTGDRQRDTLGLIKSYKAVIEDYIRKYPDQWYMFRRFWVE